MYSQLSLSHSRAVLLVMAQKETLARKQAATLEAQKLRFVLVNVSH